MKIILSKSLLSKHDEINISGDTVGEILDQLTTQYPQLTDKLFQNGSVNKFVNIYVDDENIKFLDNLDTKTDNSSEMCIETAIAGG